MPFQIVRNDITKMHCDAIVNAAKPSLLGGGGVDGAIHLAAGPKLLEECRTLGGCETGQARITKGYDLPCRYVIHTVGPVWDGGAHGEEDLLASCYKNSLFLAKSYKCESVAFPLISAGAYGYPKDKALEVAVREISSFLLENDMQIYIVVYNKSAFEISKKLVSDIREYIDENYVEEHDYQRGRKAYNVLTGSLPEYSAPSYGTPSDNAPSYNEPSYSEPSYSKPAEKSHARKKASHSMVYAGISAIEDTADLKDALKYLDESFTEMLLRKIDESGMSDAQCYKKANIDRKLFSKIRSNPAYKPSKTTAIAFAIALELPLEDTQEMLLKAGYALSHSNKFDVIIEYFIKKGNYNIYEINEALFEFDQNLLGV